VTVEAQSLVLDTTKTNTVVVGCVMIDTGEGKERERGKAAREVPASEAFWVLF
jgi:predicted ribosome-associated RNA-binding protein Tma20